MTTEQFLKYCKRNKPTKIIPTKHDIIFHFKKTVVISATNGIDGIIYTKRRKVIGNTKALLSSLREITPLMTNKMLEKYGDKNYKRFLKQIKKHGA